MKRSATAVAVAQTEADALLQFKLKPYQPRAAAPLPDRVRERALPQSIKDAIVHWLDEQL